MEGYLGSECSWDIDVSTADIDSHKIKIDNVDGDSESGSNKFLPLRRSVTNNDALLTSPYERPYLE